MRAALAVLVLLITGFTSPYEPPCVHLMLALPGYTLNADSLAAEGWNVLPGDTIAVLEIEQERCVEEEAPFAATEHVT